MNCLKTNLKHAEKIKKKLIETKTLNTDYKIKKDQTKIYFPITNNIKKIKIDEPHEITTEKFEKQKKQEKNLKKQLTTILSPQELKKIKTAFDTIGEIAILEIDEELRTKEKLIAQTLLESHKNITTILRKDDKHDGEFRTQKMKHLAGKKTKETTHKENNILLKLNVETVYYSPRLSTERKRITQQVKKDENILVMFSGCAPYPCVLAKNTQAKKITGIELNPQGHKYGLENTKLNKLNNVHLINADVREECKKIKEKYDRILMPLPKNAEDFLEPALNVSKQGTIIHFYNFLHETQFEEAEQKVKKACEKNNFKYKKIQLVKCGQQSPRTYRICLDFQVFKKNN